jgi:hypothetical protein
MPFKLKNKEIKKIVSSPAKMRGGKAADGSAYAISRGPARRRKLKNFDPIERDKEKTAKRKRVDKSKDKSPMKGKLKPCQKAAAKRKFKVYPSAYANMWASRHKC